MKRDYYEILGVARDADDADIKKAFRRKARELHPDVNPDPQAEAQFKEAAEAYEALSNAETRELYDRYGHDGLRGRTNGADFADFGSFQDLFDAFFGGDIFARQTGRAAGDDIGIAVQPELRRVGRRRAAAARVLGGRGVRDLRGQRRGAEQQHGALHDLRRAGPGAPGGARPLRPVHAHPGLPAVRGRGRGAQRAVQGLPGRRPPADHGEPDGGHPRRHRQRPAHPHARPRSGRRARGAPGRPLRAGGGHRGRALPARGPGHRDPRGRAGHRRDGRGHGHRAHGGRGGPRGAAPRHPAQRRVRARGQGVPGAQRPRPRRPAGGGGGADPARAGRGRPPGGAEARRQRQTSATTARTRDSSTGSSTPSADAGADPAHRDRAGGGGRPGARRGLRGARLRLLETTGPGGEAVLDFWVPALGPRPARARRPRLAGAGVRRPGGGAAPGRRVAHARCSSSTGRSRWPGGCWCARPGSRRARPCSTSRSTPAWPSAPPSTPPRGPAWPCWRACRWRRAAPWTPAAARGCCRSRRAAWAGTRSGRSIPTRWRWTPPWPTPAATAWACAWAAGRSAATPCPPPRWCWPT